MLGHNYMFDASVVVRTKNEETWIAHCLSAISTQKNVRFETILVDNMSTDKTLEIAAGYDLNLLKISQFLPGKALNLGFNQAQGEFVICLSGHCVPTDDYWLEKLLSEFQDTSVAGVYGRQLPLSYSSAIDKRDLLTVFGLDRKVQSKDPFFHNANSAIRKSIWDEIPFDDSVTNVEDRIWGKKIIENGYKLVYNPEAKVYHWHGINHDANPDRAIKVMGVLENAGVYAFDEAEPNPVGEFKPLCVFPVRDSDLEVIGLPSVLKQIDDIKQNFIDTDLVILTDSSELPIMLENKAGIKIEFRSKSLSPDYIDIFEVLREHEGKVVEVCGSFSHWILFNGHFPFRDWDKLNSDVAAFDNRVHDSLVVVTPILHSIWTQSEESKDKSFEWQKEPPTAIKEDAKYTSLFGYGSILSRGFVQGSNLHSSRIKLSIVSNRLNSLELKSRDEWIAFNEILGMNSA